MSHINRHGDIWNQIEVALHHKYQVQCWIDLLYYDLDFDLTRLYNHFLPFANATFDHDQRIVVLHRDTDYYTALDQPGFNLWNLYAICAYLNVPSEFIILLSAHPGIEVESQKIAFEFNVPAFCTRYTPYQWWPVPEEVISIDVNVESIEYPYVCLNGQPRPHRLYTLSKLKQFDLLDQGMVTLWPDAAPITYDNSQTPQMPNTKPIPKDLHLRTTINNTRINSQLVLSADQKAFYHDNYNLICHKRTHFAVQGIPNEDSTRYQPLFLQRALWNVVTESVGDYPYGYLTEKTVKAILTKRPFVILGGQQSLKTVRDLGFKTFDRWIDETYDQHNTFANRVDQAISSLAKFSAPLQQTCSEMIETLDYNFDFYINEFGQRDLARFITDKL